MRRGAVSAAPDPRTALDGTSPQSKDRPFFFYLSHWAPHTPLQATRAKTTRPCPTSRAIASEDWTSVGMMHYRSRRDLIDIASKPAFQGSHEFKIAATTKTIWFPADPWFQLGDPRLVLALAFVAIGELVGRRERRSRSKGRRQGLRGKPLRAAGLRQDLPQRRVVAHGLELLA